MVSVPVSIEIDGDPHELSEGVQLAKQFGALYYPFILDGVALNPKLNQADGMHPNPAGVKIIVARMLPDVKKMLAQVQH